jgi:hypothetical protein
VAGVPCWRKRGLVSNGPRGLGVGVTVGVGGTAVGVAVADGGTADGCP